MILVHVPLLLMVFSRVFNGSGPVIIGQTMEYLMDIVIKVKTIVDDISEKMPDQFNIHDIMGKCEERTPYIIVCFQVKYFFLLLKKT